MARTYPIVAVGVILDELEVLLDTDHRPRVTGEGDDGERTEDGIDGASLEAELAKVSAREMPQAS